MTAPLPSRELVILRHAKSDWDSGAEHDFDRPLNGRGKRDAPRMGRWMKERGLIPDLVISSPAKRAKGTVKAVVKALGKSKDDIHWEERVYEASLQTLLGLVSGLPTEFRRVLLVGHNPGLEELVSYLISPSQLPEPPVGFLKTGALARLTLDTPWAELERGGADLTQLMLPKQVEG